MYINVCISYIHINMLYKKDMCLEIHDYIHTYAEIYLFKEKGPK